MPDFDLERGLRTRLGPAETERAIKFIKDYFQDHLAAALNLQRVSAPLFLRRGSGVNVDLNGVETKAAFQIKDDGGSVAECLFSLAKRKRMVLADCGFGPGEGLYTGMNAIRADEECLDNLHSIYVDRRDWERVIAADERHLDFLKQIVRRIYTVLKETKEAVDERYRHILPMLPDEISFVHAEELLERWPDLGPRQREDKITQEKGAVFVVGIGGALQDGPIHDGRARTTTTGSRPPATGTKASTATFSSGTRC